MLNKPHIINNKHLLENIFKEDNFVVVDLYKDLNVNLINNYIVRSILEKFPERINFFKSLMISKYEDFTWNKPMFNSDLFELIQQEFINIHIIFTNYENLSNDIRTFINTLFRISFIGNSGKIIFHINSKYNYNELLNKGYSFSTFYSSEQLSLDEDIFNI